LGRQIAAERVGAGFSQKELARRVEISPEAMGRYERGERDIPFSVVRKVAAEFGLKTSQLLQAAEDRAERDA